MSRAHDDSTTGEVSPLTGLTGLTAGSAFQPEARGAFGGFIGPKNLVGLVVNAAPFLFDGSHPQTSEVPGPGDTSLDELARHPLGWWSILRAHDRVQASESPSAAQRTDYFALCLAAHFASVATYVPTDVDTKIRHALWFEEDPREELERRAALALALGAWDISHISARTIDVDGVGLVSGHDGERLSVLCGGALGLWARGVDSAAAELAREAEEELAREARAFELLANVRGRELELLNLANALTHNAGDVMQALDTKGAKAARHSNPDASAFCERVADLARERFERFGGAFGRAAALYRELLASEGHRNYPLRELRFLRASHELLLPLGPFLDTWGAKLAKWPKWNPAQRAEIVGGIIVGCRKVAGQESYYRALAGFEAAFSGGIESRELANHYPSAVKRQLKDLELKKKLAVRRESFESSYAKRARAVLGRRS